MNFNKLGMASWNLQIFRANRLQFRDPDLALEIGECQRFFMAFDERLVYFTDSIGGFFIFPLCTQFMKLLLNIPPLTVGTLTYYIQTDNIYTDIHLNINMQDTSDYPCRRIKERRHVT